MNQADLHFFIDSTVNYFQEITNEQAESGIPYIKEEQPIILEYTGIIGISGKKKGSVYITATAAMLSDLAKIILVLERVEKEDIMDLVGEIANTISGNVREAYGSDFLISVPVIIEGKKREIALPGNVPTFVIPLMWRHHKLYLVVCLE
jgi:chemotaxis protein CheX